ncbi:phosphatidylglycerophosphatase A [Blochmannia endosymbiont of Colobopsis nipponica]|nr:phosphatidylglycerophosphatase A [Blochmannia endosymbiont of Colobopsis nipponica]
MKKKIQLFSLFHLLATVFGIGKIPYMPGSIASLLAIFVWLSLISYSYYLYLFTLIFFLIFGCYCCHKTSKHIGVHDHQSIVLDEFIGMWIALAGVPTSHWYCLALSFFLFRILDICKPWPINWLDKVMKGGIGIMIDDIAAGMLTSVILYVIL